MFQKRKSKKALNLEEIIEKKQEEDVEAIPVEKKEKNIKEIEIENHLQNDQVQDLYGIKVRELYKNPITTDFNPSICKDFLENGYCTWGSTCIYAHVRTPQINNQQIHKKFQKFQNEKKKQKLKALNKEEDEQQQCSICKRSEQLYKNVCNHLYCENCILKDFKECQICNQKLSNSFSQVTQRIKKICKF